MNDYTAPRHTQRPRTSLSERAATTETDKCFHISWHACQSCSYRNVIAVVERSDLIGQEVLMRFSMTAGLTVLPALAQILRLEVNALVLITLLFLVHVYYTFMEGVSAFC